MRTAPIHPCQVPFITHPELRIASSLIHSFTTGFLFPDPFSLVPAFVIHVTVSTNSPLFGVQSHETNRHGRLFFLQFGAQVQ